MYSLQTLLCLQATIKATMGIRRYDDGVTNNNCLLCIAQVSEKNRPYLDIEVLVKWVIYGISTRVYLRDTILI